MAPNAVTNKAIFEYLGQHGRDQILADPDCPVAIAAASGVLRLKGKTKTREASTRGDMIEWADDNVDGFLAWRLAAENGSKKKAAAAASPAPAPAPATEPRAPPPSSDSDSDSDDEMASAPAESEGEESGPPAPVRSAPKPKAPRPARSASVAPSVSAVPLFPERPEIRTNAFYEWLVFWGFVEFDPDTGNFSFQRIRAKGPHQDAARQKGFDIGRKFTVADSKKAAARAWKLGDNVDIPDRGNLDALRSRARMSPEEQMALERGMSGVAIR